MKFVFLNVFISIFIFFTSAVFFPLFGSDKGKKDKPLPAKELSLNAEIISQSSVSEWENRGGHDLFGKDAGRYAFHTDDESNPYILIGLKNPSILKRIFVENRRDRLQERAKTLELWISDDLLTWRKVWDAQGKVEKQWDITLNNEKAQYIRFTLAEKNALHLAKVKIFGTEL